MTDDELVDCSVCDGSGFMGEDADWEDRDNWRDRGWCPNCDGLGLERRDGGL